MCENLLAKWQPRVYYTVIPKTWFFRARCGIGLLTKSKSKKKLKTLQNGVFGLGVQWDLAGSRRNCVLAAAALPG